MRRSSLLENIRRRACVRSSMALRMSYSVNPVFGSLLNRSPTRKIQDYTERSKARSGWARGDVPSLILPSWHPPSLGRSASLIPAAASGRESRCDWAVVVRAGGKNRARAIYSKRVGGRELARGEEGDSSEARSIWPDAPEPLNRSPRMGATARSARSRRRPGCVGTQRSSCMPGATSLAVLEKSSTSRDSSR